MSKTEGKVTSKTSVAKEVTAVNSVPTVKETRIYIGDSIPHIGLQENAVFRNGIPEALNRDIEKCPAIERLMVPVKKAAEAKKNLALIGSKEAVLNQQINSYARGEI